MSCVMSITPPPRVGEGAEVVERAHGQIQVEAGRGLVGHDDARVVHERAAQKNAARHAPPDSSCGYFPAVSSGSP